MIVAQLDKDSIFVGYEEDYNQGLPSGCITTLPPDDPLSEYQKWQWDTKKKKYTQIEDYRGVDIYRTDGTIYQPETWGPLPEGHSPTPPIKKLTFKDKIQELEFLIARALHEFVNERHYDSIEKCLACYLQSPDKQYRKEAETVNDLNTKIWKDFYKIVEEAEENISKLPTEQELFDKLPKLEW